MDWGKYRAAVMAYDLSLIQTCAGFLGLPASSVPCVTHIVEQFFVKATPRFALIQTDQLTLGAH